LIAAGDPNGIAAAREAIEVYWAERAAACSISSKSSTTVATNSAPRAENFAGTLDAYFERKLGGPAGVKLADCPNRSI
jgi:hypothetical protein